MFAVIVSERDIAGMNIREQLLKLNATASNFNLITIKQDSIHADNLDINADFFIFATKHKAESGIPCLTVHVPGNWGNAELGGKFRGLCIAPACLVKALIIELHKQAGSKNVSLECTHHGPFLEKPACFIEIGSSEKEWKDLELGKIIARVIVNVLSKHVQECPAVFCAGSSHYPEKFTKFALESEYAVGHICPKYAIENLDFEMFKQAIERTYEKVEAVVIDKKLKSEDRKKVEDFAEEMKLKVIKV
ncbi:hypothetical protein HZB88_05010 [archaeon]|nr:hypothetical protein [archaeon]